MFPDSDEQPLIHQDLLDRLPSAAKVAANRLGGEPRFERLGSDRGVIGRPLVLVEQKQGAEAAHVPVDQLARRSRAGARSTA